MLLFLGAFVTLFGLSLACTTPDGRAGSCIDLRQCTELYNLVAFKRPLTSEDRSFLSRSQCGYANNSPMVKVCCANTSGGPAANVLPARGTCGLGSSNRIYGGEETDLDEFPWNCLIEYSKPGNQSGTHCGCVLINQHYVLTASHCVNGKDIPTTWRPSRIHLGEWDTSSNPDCALGECAPPVQKIRVSKITPHQEYVPTSRNQFNDIALIRLEQPVAYNDFVKPICLPLDQNLRSKLHVGEALEVSGWGKTETVSASTKKLKVRVNGVDRQSCGQTYSRQNVQLAPTQICAGGERGRDSCRGDSGGPLTATDNSNPRQLATYLVGLVSYGPSPCGQAGWPGVYTKVSEYVDWVQDNMEP